MPTAKTVCSNAQYRCGLPRIVICVMHAKHIWKWSLNCGEVCIAHGLARFKSDARTAANRAKLNFVGIEARMQAIKKA